jgi:hypothetical protein
MTDIIIVRGSYGNLHVHANSGLVIERERDFDNAEYDDIVWFDPFRLPRYDIGECDILDTAFVTDKGVYVRELVSAPVGGGEYEWVNQRFLEHRHD